MNAGQPLHPGLTLFVRLRIRHGQCKRVDAFSEGEDGNRGAVNDDGADDQEGRDWPDEFDNIQMFETWFRKHSQWSGSIGFEFSSGQDGDKDATDTNRAKVACKQGFSPRLDVRDRGFEQKHDRDAAKQQNEDSQNDQSPGIEADDGRVELGPWDDGAKVDEKGQVDEQIDDVGDVRFFSLFCEPAIVTETHTTGEAH